MVYTNRPKIILIGSCVCNMQAMPIHLQKAYLDFEEQSLCSFIFVSLKLSWRIFECSFCYSSVAMAWQSTDVELLTNFQIKRSLEECKQLLGYENLISYTGLT